MNNFNPYTNLPYMPQMNVPNNFQTNNYIPQQPTNNLVRVTGLDGAKAYKMPENSVALLIDDQDDLFYIKTTDGAGFASYRTFRFEEVTGVSARATDASENNFVTRDEFEAFKKEVTRNGKQYIPKQQSANTSARTEQ